jgi:hypothetical protein
VTCRLIFFGRLLGMGSSDPLRAFFVFPIAGCRWSRGTAGVLYHWYAVH